MQIGFCDWLYIEPNLIKNVQTIKILFLLGNS